MTTTLAGVAVSRGTVSLPMVGIWTADLDLVDAGPVEGTHTLALPGLALVGTIVRGQEHRGRTSIRMVGGKGGWRSELPERSYRNDGGVRASWVAKDAAQACGESVSVPSYADALLGPSYARQRGPASAVLEHVRGAYAWWIDEQGVTQIGKRDDSAAALVRVLELRAAEGVAIVAADFVDSLLPGRTVRLGSESYTIGRVVHRIEPTGLRSEIWRDDAPRELASLIRSALPNAAYHGVWEYRVAAQSGQRVDVEPARPSGMPALAGVPLRMGIPGVKATLPVGARVLVAFVDGSPFRPVVVSFAPSDGPNDELPSELALLGGTAAVLRVGDAVSIDPGNSSGIVAGTITVTGTAAKVKA